jgi:hypothetical protein
MSRPLIQRRIDELEAMFEAEQGDPDALRLLEVELALTLEVLRPAERMVSMRMILPNWLMSIISVVSSTRLMAETLPILGVVFMEMTPCRQQ